MYKMVAPIVIPIININNSFSLLSGYYNDRYEISLCDEESGEYCYYTDAEHLPEVEGIYYFGINFRKSFFNTNNVRNHGQIFWFFLDLYCYLLFVPLGNDSINLFSFNKKI